MDKEGSSIKTIARGAGIAFLGIIGSKFLTYLFRLVVARYGVQNYGLISLAIMITTFAVIFSNLGLEKALLRYIPYFFEKKQRDKAKGTLIACIAYSLALSIIFAGLLIVFSDEILRLFFPNITAIEFKTIFLIVVLTIPLHTIAKVLIMLFKAFKKPEYEVYTKNITEGTVKLVLTLALFIAGFGIVSVSIAYVFSIFASVMLATFLFWKQILPAFAGVKAKFATVEIVKYSLPLMFMGLFVTVMASIDTFMVGYFKDEYAVGIYNAVTPTAQLMYVFPVAILTLFVPVLTEMYARKSKFIGIYHAVTKWITICSALLLGIFAAYSKDIIRMLFGSDYASGNIALLAISGGYFIYFMVYSSESMLLVIKKTNILLYNYIATSALNLALNCLLIPKYGINGAAISTGISYVVLGAILLLESKYYANAIPFDKSVWKIMLAGIFTTFLFCLVSKAVSVQSITMLFMSIAFFSIIYLISLLLLGCFNDEDNMIISSIEKRMSLKSSPISKFLKRFIKNTKGKE